MKGVQLLDHMTNFSQHTHGGNESDYGISSYLNTASPKSYLARQKVLLDEHQNVMGGLMEDFNVGISCKKAIKARMDALGLIKGRSGTINDPEWNKRMKNRLELMASMADIAEKESQEKASKKKAAKTVAERFAKSFAFVQQCCRGQQIS